jgi:hypothetical protein
MAVFSASKAWESTHSFQVHQLVLHFQHPFHAVHVQGVVHGLVVALELAEQVFFLVKAIALEFDQFRDRIDVVPLPSGFARDHPFTE